jgi:hypothetical protein
MTTTIFFPRTWMLRHVLAWMEARREWREETVISNLYNREEGGYYFEYTIYNMNSKPSSL